MEVGQRPAMIAAMSYGFVMFQTLLSWKSVSGYLTSTQGLPRSVPNLVVMEVGQRRVILLILLRGFYEVSNLVVMEVGQRHL